VDKDIFCIGLVTDKTFVYCVSVSFKILTFNGEFSFGKRQNSQGTESGL